MNACGMTIQSMPSRLEYMHTETCIQKYAYRNMHTESNTMSGDEEEEKNVKSFTRNQTSTKRQTVRIRKHIKIGDIWCCEKKRQRKTKASIQSHFYSWIKTKWLNGWISSYMNITISNLQSIYINNQNGELFIYRINTMPCHSSFMTWTCWLYLLWESKA